MEEEERVKERKALEDGAKEEGGEGKVLDEGAKKEK